MSDFLFIILRPSFPLLSAFCMQGFIKRSFICTYFQKSCIWVQILVPPSHKPAAFLPVVHAVNLHTPPDAHRWSTSFLLSLIADKLLCRQGCSAMSPDLFSKISSSWVGPFFPQLWAFVTFCKHESRVVVTSDPSLVKGRDSNCIWHGQSRAQISPGMVSDTSSHRRVKLKDFLALTWAWQTNCVWREIRAHSISCSHINLLTT